MSEEIIRIGSRSYGKTFDEYWNRIINLQQENKKLKEENDEFYKLMEMQNKREYRSKFLKDFQKEKGKNVFPDYDEIYKRYYEYKSRIDKTIEYIKQETIDNREYRDVAYRDGLNNVLEILGDKE